MAIRRCVPSRSHFFTVLLLLRQNPPAVIQPTIHGAATYTLAMYPLPFCGVMETQSLDLWTISSSWRRSPSASPCRLQ